MKRLKQLLVTAIAAVMAFSVVALAACGGSDDTKTLSSISVDSSAAKTEYTVGEEFSSSGIVVTATYSDATTAEISSGNYTVDSTAYSTTTAGTYSITVSYTESEVTKTASYSVTVTAATQSGLSSISVDTSNATTLFYLNQSFDSTGLVVTAVIDGETVDVSNSSGLSIDRSAYVSSTAGTYRINVFYEYGKTSKSTSYTVTVTDELPKAGLDILVDGEVTSITSVAITGATITLSADIISGVNLHEINGEDTTDTALSASDYTVKFYSESDAETELTGDALTVSNGTYILEVTYEGYVDPAYGTVYTLSSFVIITIDNPIKSIAVNADTGTFTQPAGSDKISSTWTYTLTYSNGSTAQLTSSDVKVTTIDTATVSSSSTATVSYTLDGVTVTCEVTYSITESTGVTYNYAMSISELVAAVEARTGETIADKTQLATSDFTGSNAFLTLLAEQSSNQYRTNNNGVIEIKGEGLSVTFYGTGTITISFASTGSSNISSLALIDENGNYITGVLSETTATTQAVSTNNGYYYNVTGSSTYVTITFTVSTAGTYIIATNLDSEQNRGARLSSIVMVDET